MFAIKGWMKVTLFFSVFFVAGFAMHEVFQVQEADAQGGRIRQWTVTIRGTAVYGSYYLADISKGCNQCSCPKHGHRRQQVLKDYVATIHYFDDGEHIYSEPGTFSWVSGTQKAGSTYDVWFTHYHESCHTTYLIFRRAFHG